MLQEASITHKPPYLTKLNPEQRAAVEAVDGAVLVLAGAGTGKTRVLTTRIAHILALRKAYPGQILAVTFTNKAAREMGERVQHLIHGEPTTNNEQRSPLGWMGTFHSIAAKILRRYGEAIGFKSNFTILDTDDQLRLLKQIIQEKNLDDKQFPPKQALAIISSWKDQGLVPEKVSGTDSSHAMQGKAIILYKAFQDRLRSLNAMDFGDLLLHNLTLFTQHPEIHREIANRFHYILVDEYQDTNVAQYLWLRLLASAHRNICCVGDDDQSIYGWRGAEVGNILRFEKDFPGATVIRLERNYRSTGNILAAASGLIAHNSDRLGKTLWTEGEAGDKVRLRSLWDGDEEARFVGDEVENLQRQKVSLNEMAILVRAGFQTRAFEERFLTLGIGYRVIGGLRFYERLEIRDTIAYLRVVEQPYDDLAFERIINTPKRGIGTATLEQIHSYARTHDIPMTAATQRLLESNVFKGKLANSLTNLLKLFDSWRALIGTMPIGELTERVLEESNYRAMWQLENSPEAQGRLENLKELTRAMGEFESLTAFLEHVGLVTEMSENTTGDMISLMTLHAAKGLEFDHVFLPGWEEGLFPHQRSLDESGRNGLEEERRLAYVGITRARKSVAISYAGSRRIYNQWQSSIPSRFIGELPKDHIEKDSGLGQRGIDSWIGGRGSVQETERSSFTLLSLTPVSTFTRPSNSVEQDSHNFKEGVRVFHVKFGYGRVLSVSGDTLEIGFDKADVKKVKAAFVQKA